jgi:hypothetical protein
MKDELDVKSWEPGVESEATCWLRMRPVAALGAQSAIRNPQSAIHNSSFIIHHSHVRPYV